MTTYSPESMRGSMENPDTCDGWTVNAKANAPSNATWRATLAADRQRMVGDTTAPVFAPTGDAYFKIRMRSSGQKSKKAWPVKRPGLPFSGPLAKLPRTCANPQIWESSELLRLSPIMK